MKLGPKEIKVVNEYFVRPVKNRLKEIFLKKGLPQLKNPDEIQRPQRALDKEAIDAFMKRNPMAGGGRIGFKKKGYVKMTPEEKAAAYAKRDEKGVASALIKEKKFKDVVDKIFEKEDFGNFKAKVTESQLRAAKKAGKVRAGTGIVPAQYIKQFNQAIAAGVDSPEFKNILRITGRSTDDILKLNRLRPGGKTLTKVRAAAAEESFPDSRKKTLEQKAETQKKAKKTRGKVITKAKKFASESDLQDLKIVEKGKENINKFFEKNPDAINNTPFGKKIKAMMSLRMDQEGKFFSKLMSDDYFRDKAAKGDLFDIFDLKPVVKSGSRFVRVPYNINITPGQFNQAFIEGQVSRFFEKGVNLESLKNLNNFLTDKNIRVELPNVGYTGAKPDVAVTAGTKEGTRTFPRIIETLKRLDAPKEILQNFIDITPSVGPLKIFKPLKKFEDGGRVPFRVGTAAKKIAMGALTPSGVATLLTPDLDLTKAENRISLATEAALAPELIKASIGATKGMKNRKKQKLIQQLLNLGVPTKKALRIARIASPIGIGSLILEGTIAGAKRSMKESKRIDAIQDKERQMQEFDNLIKNIKGFAGGGIAKLAGDSSGAMLQSMNPDKDGLLSLMKRGKKI